MEDQVKNGSISWIGIYFDLFFLDVNKYKLNIIIYVPDSLMLRGPFIFQRVSCTAAACCFIYHYKERCFPGEDRLNREAQSDKSLFDFHHSLNHNAQPIGDKTPFLRPIRWWESVVGVAWLTSGPIHIFHFTHFGHLVTCHLKLVHFLFSWSQSSSEKKVWGDRLCQEFSYNGEKRW